ncbi:MAG: HAMP domain-containing protein [Chthoniobacterales bacterium]|nr:HAMP domain-containing protein [Chthoniobacterales bacterium]
MFWKPLRDFTRTLSFRLNVWHAAIFLGSAALVFTLIYFLLGAAIERKDRDVIEARLREYIAVYQGGGIPALRDWTSRVNEARKERMFFVRVTNANGAVQLEVMPQDWFDQDLQRVDEEAKAEADDWRRLPRNGETDLTLATRVLDDGTIFQVGRSSDSRETLLGKFRQVFVIIIPPVLLIGFIGGALLTRRMTKPICALVEAAASIINTGRMDVRVPERRADDELQELVVLFNRMLEHNEKLFRTLRDSLDNVAHDLRTPLSRLRLSLEESLRTRSDGTQDAIIDALEETERVQTIIRTLMDVAQAESGLMPLNLVAADVGSLIADVIDLYDHIAQEKQIAIATEMGESISLPLDAARMRQAFANLLDNAIKYTPPHGRVTIAVRARDGNVEVIFSDTGVGIAEKDLPRIWERLYRTDQSRSASGLGLGLSLVKAIVEAHGGRMEVSSAEGKGSAFGILLRGAIASAGTTP